MTRIGIILLALLWAQTAWGQFSLNGQPASADALTSTYLFTIPEAAFGCDYTAVVEIDACSAWTDLRINGELVTSGDSCTFRSVEGGKGYAMTARSADGTILSGEIYFTFLPIVNLTGEFGYRYRIGEVRLLMPGRDDTTTWHMPAKIKWRGFTTNVEGKHKRNYHIKFIDDEGNKLNRKFFGLRSDNDWLLDAGQDDLARCRNRVATDLWLSMCRPPYYIDKEPKALSGSRGRMCEVFLNGNYHGIYNMMENVDAKQTRVAHCDDDLGEQRGHLWKSQQLTQSTYMVKPVAHDRPTSKRAWLFGLLYMMESDYAIAAVAPTIEMKVALGVVAWMRTGDADTLARSWLHKSCEVFLPALTLSSLLSPVATLITVAVTRAMHPAADNTKLIESSCGLTTKYPDVDDVWPPDYSVINSAINFVSDAPDDVFADSVAVYFDMPVMVDYYIYLNTMMACDNISKNTYWVCYNQQESTMLTLAVWDLNVTAGGIGSFWGQYEDRFGPEVDLFDKWGYNILFYRLESLDSFRQEVRARYMGLRQGPLSTDSVTELYGRAFSNLVNSGAAMREQARWSGDSDVDGRELDIAAEGVSIDDWLRRRLAYLDEKFAIAPQ